VVAWTFGTIRGPAGLIAGIVLILALADPGAAQVGPPDQGPITVTADHLEYDQQSGGVVGDGHVVATRGSTTITADHLTGDLKTGDVEAAGHVTLKQPDRTLTGESLHYNYQTRAGSMSQAVLKSGPWTLKGQSADTTAARGEVRAVAATPCDPAHPAFLVKATRVVVVPGDHLTAYHATLYVYGVPVATIPVYTASLKQGRKASSGPTVGYDNFNGIWVQYSQYVPLGDWQGQVRALFGTRSGVSGEAIFDRAYPDYLLDVHLGRTATFDQNGNEFNLDQYSGEIDLYSHRVPGLPLTYSARVQAGSFAEGETGVTAFRTDGQFSATTDTIRLTPSLSASAGGYYQYDTYSTGNVRTIWTAAAALTEILSPATSTTLSYYFATVYGTTPFQFDVISPNSVATLSYSYYPSRGLFQSGTIGASYDFVAQQTSATVSLAFAISPTLQFGTNVQYNLTTQQFTEIDYSVNATCDCVGLGLVYRTFPASPSSNQWFITLGINSLPGINTTVRLGSPP
jgi:LptA/(LptD N-terminal domain) LPS transport protein